MADQHIGERPAFTGPVLDTTELLLAMAGTNALQRGTAAQVKGYIGGGTATATEFTPAGSVAATTVQAAIEELDTDKAPYKPGVVTTSQPALDLTQEWNAAGVAFTGYKLGIKDTASAAGSLHTNFGIGAASIASLSKTGHFKSVSFGFGASSGVRFIGSDNSLYFNGIGGFNPHAGLHESGGLFRFALRSTAAFGWTPDGADYNLDVPLFRDAAGVLAQRDGLNSQTLRVYNVYTSPSNRENFAISWASNTCTIGTETNGATLRPLVISGSTISASAPFFPKQYTTATRPAWTNGAQIFDTDLDKLVVGGASGWEVVTSV